MPGWHEPLRAPQARRSGRIVFDVDTMLAGFDSVAALAGAPDRYVPGHDPEVLKRHPPVSPELAGIACRLA